MRQCNVSYTTKKCVFSQVLLSFVPAHHDEPDVKFSRPFLAGVLALCTDEAVILLSGIDPLSIPRSKSLQSPAVKNKLCNT